MAKGRVVGIIISRRSWRSLFQKKYLVLYRLVEPIGIACPAGHVEKGERFIKALWREFHEETGMDIAWMNLVYSGYIPGDCPKCEGGGHDWRVYEARGIGTPRLMEPAKHMFVKFMSKREMLWYAEHGKFDRNWLNHILPALGIIPRAFLLGNFHYNRRANQRTP